MRKQKPSGYTTVEILINIERFKVDWRYFMFVKSKLSSTFLIHWTVTISWYCFRFIVCSIKRTEKTRLLVPYSTHISNKVEGVQPPNLVPFIPVLSSSIDLVSSCFVLNLSVSDGRRTKICPKLYKLVVFTCSLYGVSDRSLSVRML